eukprot:15165-Eustigmatos_ZCMA.PRE.1
MMLIVPALTQLGSFGWASGQSQRCLKNSANPFISLFSLSRWQAINVADNKLTDKSLPFLAKALANMNNLTKLDVSDNLVGHLASIHSGQ